MYYFTFMPHQPTIDGFEFASAGATQEGTWPIREFPRLRDMLASDSGDVAYEISGVRDERGRPGLRLKVRGTLALRCQRCLEPMAFPVDTDETLVLAATLAEIHAEPASASAPDRVVAGREMALRELIEDELILVVPYAPRHDDCEPAGASDSMEKVSPFAGLRGLIRSKH
jgi:uncharacterized protein